MTYTLSLLLVAFLLVEMCHAAPEQSSFYTAENSDPMPLYMERRLAKFRGEPVRFGKRAFREPVRFGKRALLPINQLSRGGYGMMNGLEGQ